MGLDSSNLVKDVFPDVLLLYGSSVVVGHGETLKKSVISPESCLSLIKRRRAEEK
jgi:hypothetical protein